MSLEVKCPIVTSSPLTCLFSVLSLQESHIPKLLTPAEKGQDLEARLIDTYVIQCQAEAQEGIEILEDVLLLRMFILAFQSLENTRISCIKF